MSTISLVTPQALPPGKWSGQGSVTSPRGTTVITVRTKPGDVIAGRALTAANFVSFAASLNAGHIPLKHYDAADSTKGNPHTTEVGTVVPVTATFDGTLRATISTSAGLIKQIEAGAYFVSLVVVWNQEDPSVSALLLLKPSDIAADGSLVATLDPVAAANLPKAITNPRVAGSFALFTGNLPTVIVADKPSVLGVVWAADVVGMLLSQLKKQEFPIAATWSVDGKPVDGCGHTTTACSIDASGRLMLNAEIIPTVADAIQAGTVGLLPKTTLNIVGQKPAVDGDPAPPESYILPLLVGFQVINPTTFGPLTRTDIVSILRLPPGFKIG